MRSVARPAISHNRLFRPAYYWLGAPSNRQGEYAQAKQVLLAGLNIRSPGEDGVGAYQAPPPRENGFNDSS